MQQKDLGAVIQRINLGFSFAAGSIRARLGAIELMVDELDPARGMIALHVPLGIHGEVAIEYQRQVFTAAGPIEDRVLGVASQCIYCGAQSDLRDEHIIPYSLQGNFVVQAGSCTDCEKKTTRFERKIARDAWLPVRVALGLRTRRPAKRPATLPIYRRSEGEETVIQVPPSAHPTYLVLPGLDLPAHIRGDAAPNLRVMPDRMSVISVSGATLMPGSSAAPGDEIGVKMDFDPYSFARLLAKIAHGFFMVAELGDVESYLPRGILSEGESIGRWVGGAPDQTVEGHGLHGVNLFRTEAGEIHLRIRLFLQLGGPEYLVVAGRVLEPSKRPTRIVAVRC